MLFRLVLTIPFKFDLAQSRKKRNSIDLGDGLRLRTGSSEIAFDVVCSYPTSVMLESSSVSVQTVSVSGVHRGTGSLENGFALTFRILLRNRD